MNIKHPNTTVFIAASGPAVVLGAQGTSVARASEDSSMAKASQSLEKWSPFLTKPPQPVMVCLLWKDRQGVRWDNTSRQRVNIEDSTEKK